MTRTELLERLNAIKEKGTQALRLLKSKPLSVDTQTEIRRLAQWIKEELHNEYNRMLPERAQKTMSVFELSVYSPTIEETWKWHQPVEDRRTPRSKMAGTSRGCGL